MKLFTRIDEIIDNIVRIIEYFDGIIDHIDEIIDRVDGIIDHLMDNYRWWVYIGFWAKDWWK